jgi:hypothetical protein
VNSAVRETLSSNKTSTPRIPALFWVDTDAFTIPCR